MERLERSWRLVKASAAVLQADVELLVFPALASIASLLVVLSFAAPLVLGGMFDRLVTGGRVGPAAALIGFTFYFVQYFITIFANSALIGAAMIRLDGGNPSVGDGLRVAGSRLVPILGWTALAATVGMVLRSASRRGQGIGRVLFGLVGVAWSVATFLVVPVVVVEGLGPIDAVRRSVELLKRTWGEQLSGTIGLWLVFRIATVILLVVTVPAVVLAAQHQAWAVMAAIVGVAVVGMIALNLVGTALSAVFAAAVYRFAARGAGDGPISAELVQGAFTPR